MLNKCEVEKEKLKLMKSLLNVCDNDLTFLSMKTKIFPGYGIVSIGRL